jgi:putative nucleotidyltransferase with HDIG domain
VRRKTEIDIIKQKGEKIVAETHLVEIGWEDKKAYLVSIRDISGRKKTEKELKESYLKIKKTMEDTIDIMSRLVGMRDQYTALHQQKVSRLATLIAQKMGLSEDKIEAIRITSLVHDIGKINVPAEILSNPNGLTEIEFDLIKEHPKIGYDVLKKIDFVWPVAEIVLQHHERIDGSGYPRGLKDNEILIESKIISVADVVAAMSSHRPYRPALGIDKALEEISKNKGVLYDPKVVDICIKIFKEEGFRFE